jgi:hypothetical protein
MKKLLFTSFIIFAILGGLNCSVYQTITNLSRLQFKLGNVNNFSIGGVNISGKSKFQDFSALEIINLTSTLTSGKFPVSFTLNVDAKNPNDGTGGYKRTDATLQSFAWKLKIDDKQTIAGDIGSPFTVPGTGEAVVIPLTMQMDLLDFFQNNGLESLINLALALGGQQGSSSRIALLAKPTVSTLIGNISYPGELTIVDTKFTN